MYSGSPFARTDVIRHVSGSEADRTANQIVEVDRRVGHQHRMTDGADMACNAPVPGPGNGSTVVA